MTPEAIFKRLQDKFGAETVFDFHADKAKDKDPWFKVEPWQIEKVAAHLRKDPEMAFDYLECITGVDYPDDKKIVVVYHLYSYEQKHEGLSPPYAGALKKNAAAWKFFESRGTWYRKKVSWWVMSAKKEETRQARLAKLVAASARGVEL